MNKSINRIWIQSDIVKPDQANHEVRQISAWIVQDRKVIIVSKDGDSWTIPGGHPEEGESLEVSLNREVVEECGVDISKFPRTLVGYYIIQHVEDGKVVSEYLQMRYMISLKIGEIEESDLKPAENDDVKFAKFVGIEEVPEFVSWSRGNEEYGIVLNSVKF